MSNNGVDEMSTLMSSNTSKLDSWVKDMKFTVRNTIGAFRSYVRSSKSGGGNYNDHNPDQDILFKEVYAISETINNMDKEVKTYFEDLQLKLHKVQDRAEMVNTKIKEMANPPPGNLKSPPNYDTGDNHSTTSSSTSSTGGSGNPSGVPGVIPPTIVEGDVGDEG